MIKLLISSCLLGNNVTYKGSNNLIKEINALREYFEFVVICPEVMGGLPIPRVPSERNNDKVISKVGVDVTKEYQNGKNIAISLIEKHHIKYALMKSKSPACGNKEIYDGSFTHTIINKPGVTAEALNEMGVKVFNENEINDLLNEVKTLN